MSSDLPLKVRADIRDLWDKPDSSVKSASETLHKSLGHKIVPIVEWAGIWAEVKDLHPDKSSFVPTMSSIVEAWYEVLGMKIEDDTSEEWTEELLNILAELGSREIKLYVEPKGTSLKRPTASWKAQRNIFTIGIPKAATPSISRLKAEFEEDFSNMFKPDASKSGAVVPSGVPAAASIRDDDWAELMSDREDIRSLPDFSSISISSPASSRHPPARAVPDRLPSVNAILRPEDHFKVTVPYTLIVDYTGFEKNSSLRIHCSHQPTLEIISDYFQKWARKSLNDHRYPTVLRIELQDSPFSFGISDTLIIEPHYKHQYEINPTLVLTFIEGTLGYKLVHTNGSNWVYRCDTLMR